MAESPSVPGAAPRVALYSARYEATAVADHDTLTIHLDRFATNAPVTDAQLEVEAGTARSPAERLPDGSYRFRHPAVEAPGALALRLRVVEPGQPPDVLTGTLRPGPAGSAATADDHGASGSRGAHAAHPGWQRPVLWGAAALALVGAALAAARHARRRPTPPRNAAGHPSS